MRTKAIYLNYLVKNELAINGILNKICSSLSLKTEYKYFRVALVNELQDDLLLSKRHKSVVSKLSKPSFYPGVGFENSLNTLMVK